MRFELLVTEAAERDYVALPEHVRERVKQRVFALADDPLPPNAKQLTGNLRGICRVRAGDYRTGYVVDIAAATVTVAAICHRRDFYAILERRRQP